MKPDKYEGLTCFETFLTQFNNCAEYNRWSDSEKLSYLRWSLKGSAAQMLWGARDMTYKQLVTRLRSRFGSADMEEHYRVDLQCRRRKNNETMKELAQDIRRLMMLSYPGNQTPISENLAKEHFIVALEDPELELKIREREPRTLDSALRVAQRFEVFRNAVRPRKQRMSRQVIYSDEEIQVAKVEQTTGKDKQSKPSKTETRESDRSDRGKKSSGKSFGRKVKKEKYGVNSATMDTKQDDWKEEMLKKVKTLEQAQHAAEANVKKMSAENNALNKEVEKLRHNVHLQAVPPPPPPCLHPSYARKPPVQYAKPYTCYRCGQQGHMAKPCTQPIPQTSEGVMCYQNVYQNREGKCVKSKQFMPCDHEYYFRVTLACKTVDCLLDTGSEVCLVPVPESLIHQNCVKKTKRLLKAANGTPIPIVGEVKLPLAIGDFSTTIVALVSQHVKEPMLGIDFLVKNQVVWDFAKSTVIIHGVSHLLRSKQCKHRWCRRVVVQKATTIPARSEKIVSSKVQFRKMPDEIVDESWCTEIGRINGGVQVSRTLVLSDTWTNIPVRLLNTGNTDVRLKVDTPVSNLEPVTVLTD